jgi:hypothetical protein
MRELVVMAMAPILVACADTPRSTRPTTSLTSQPNVDIGGEPDEWYREVVDPAVMGSSVSIALPGDTLSVITTPIIPENQSVQFRMTEGLWQTRVLHESSRLLESTVGPGDAAWLLLQSPTGVGVARGHAGRVEILSSRTAPVLAHDIVTDPHGVPHVCFSLADGSPPKELVYASRVRASASGSTTWTLDRIPVPAMSCRLVATGRDVFIAASGDSGVVALSKVAGGSWTSEPISSTPGHVAAGRGPSGLAVLAFALNEAVQLLRVSSQRRARSQLAITPHFGDPSALAIAIDDMDRVHVALAVHDENDFGHVMYATERARKLTIVARDFTEQVAITLDADGRPKLAYVAMGPEERRFDLIYARLRSAKERDLPPRHYARDSSVQLDSCAIRIANQLGEAQDPAMAQRADRWCGPMFPPDELPPLGALVESCDNGVREACMVAGSRAGALAITSGIEIAMECTTPTKQGCVRSFTNTVGIANWLGHGPDDAGALKLFGKACRFGSRPACAVIGTYENDPRQAAELFADACSPELPLACAAALAKLDGTRASSRPMFDRIRKALAAACDSSTIAEACNALAYMEEAALGGPRSAEAQTHHARACELGSVTSCTRLLVGPFARMNAPGQLDKRRFEESLSNSCTGEFQYESACLALSVAFETGWGVDRDVTKAARFLDEACRLGSVTACKRHKP